MSAGDPRGRRQDGPHTGHLAKHAADLAGHPLEVIAISRYSNATRQWLENNGVQTHTADLAEASIWAELPDSENVIYLVGNSAPKTILTHGQ